MAPSVSNASAGAQQATPTSTTRASQAPNWPKVHALAEECTREVTIILAPQQERPSLKTILKSVDRLSPCLNNILQELSLYHAELVTTSSSSSDKDVCKHLDGLVPLFGSSGLLVGLSSLVKALRLFSRKQERRLIANNMGFIKVAGILSRTLMMFGMSVMEPAPDQAAAVFACSGLAVILADGLLEWDKELQDVDKSSPSLLALSPMVVLYLKHTGDWQLVITQLLATNYLPRACRLAHHALISSQDGAEQEGSRQHEILLQLCQGTILLLLAVCYTGKDLPKQCKRPLALLQQQLRLSPEVRGLAHSMMQALVKKRSKTAQGLFKPWGLAISNTWPKHLAHREFWRTPWEYIATAICSFVLFGDDAKPHSNAGQPPASCKCCNVSHTQLLEAWVEAIKVLPASSHWVPKSHGYRLMTNTLDQLPADTRERLVPILAEQWLTKAADVRDSIVRDMAKCSLYDQAIKDGLNWVMSYWSLVEVLICCQSGPSLVLSHGGAILKAAEASLRRLPMDSFYVDSQLASVIKYLFEQHGSLVSSRYKPQLESFLASMRKVLAHRTHVMLKTIHEQQQQEQDASQSPALAVAGQPCEQTVSVLDEGAVQLQAAAVSQCAATAAAATSLSVTSTCTAITASDPAAAAPCPAVAPVDSRIIEQVPAAVAAAQEHVAVGQQAAAGSAVPDPAQAQAHPLQSEVAVPAISTAPGVLLDLLEVGTSNISTEAAHVSGKEQTAAMPQHSASQADICDSASESSVASSTGLLKPPLPELKDDSALQFHKLAPLSNDSFMYYFCPLAVCASQHLTDCTSACCALVIQVARSASIFLRVTPEYDDMYIPPCYLMELVEMLAGASTFIFSSPATAVPMRDWQLLQLALGQALLDCLSMLPDTTNQSSLDAFDKLSAVLPADNLLCARISTLQEEYDELYECWRSNVWDDDADAPDVACDGNPLNEQVIWQHAHSLVNAGLQPAAGCWHRGCINLHRLYECSLKTHRCKGCRVACYCSQACHEADWQVHGRDCRKLRRQAVKKGEK